MKKFVTLLMLLCLPIYAQAATKTITPADVTKAEANGNFTITSDSRKFNPISGEYDLNGHVFVSLPTHGEQLVIKADKAKVKLYSQEVNAEGKITLSFGKMSFRCDKTHVVSKERTAYVDGNILFKHLKNTIKADSASYYWKGKLATFQNASVNGGQPQKEVKYNVMSGEFVK